MDDDAVEEPVADDAVEGFVADGAAGSLWPSFLLPQVSLKLLEPKWLRIIL